MTTICRHIHTNGKRCGSPALRNQTWCFYHRRLRSSHAEPGSREALVLTSRNGSGTDPEQVVRPTPRLNLPALEDRESIQVALSLIIGALARNDLDTKRATTLLYGLQVASSNAANLDHEPSRDYLVTETTTDESGTELAPDEDPHVVVRQRQIMQELDEELDDEEEDDDDQDDDGDDDEYSDEDDEDE